MSLGPIFPNGVLTCHLSSLTLFSDKGAHSAKNFLGLAFVGYRHEVKCMCNRCQNRRLLFEYEMSGNIAKQGFVLNYLVWHQHREERAPTADELDGNDDKDRMDDIIADIGMEYDLGSEDQHPPPKVQNFYRLLAASDEKVHDGTNLSTLQAVMRLMEMKSMYNFSNQCYNDIVKLIIDLIPMKHNMPKDLYPSKKIVVSLGMNYEKIDACEKNFILFWKGHKNDTECMNYGRSRYMKVVNEDGTSVTTKVVVKELRYMPITPRRKQFFLSEEIVKQMRWNKKGKHDSEDSDIILHPVDDEAWQALDRFDPEFVRDPRRVRLGLSTDCFQHYSINSSLYSC
jgi:hypothetical protein